MVVKNYSGLLNALIVPKPTKAKARPAIKRCQQIVPLLDGLAAQRTG
jgi:hypothetical protein